MSVTAPARVGGRRERRLLSTAIVGLGALLGALLPLEDARGIDPEVPTVSDVSTSPDPVSAAGGTVRVSAVLQSPAGIASAGVSVYLGGDPGGQTGAAMTRSAPGSGTWIADVTVPANNGQDAVSHQLEFSVTGNDGGEALELVGGIDQLGQGEPFDQLPYVDDVTVAPQFLLAAGGDVTISAHVTDDRAVSEVYATAYAPDGSSQTVEMNGVGGDDYEGVFTVPANTEAHPVAWSFDVHGLDDIGQETTAAGNQVYLDADVPATEPVDITDITVSPDHLGSEGGVVSVTATITSPAGVADASLAVYLFGAGTEYADLTRVAAGSDTFRGEVTIGGNGSTDAVSHQVEVFANGLDGGSGSAFGPGIDQDGQGQFDQAPYVTVTSVGPTTLPSTGGTVTIQASASDDRAVSEVYATITRDDGVETVVGLATGVSWDVYEGTFTAPPNASGDPVVYSVEATAVDDGGNATTGSGPAFVVLPQNAAPEVTLASVSPGDLPEVGGRVRMTATVTDADGEVASVTATVVDPVGGVTEVPMARRGDSHVFQGGYRVPANGSGQAAHHVVTVTGVDDQGASTTVAAGSVTVAGVVQFVGPAPAPQPGTVQLSAQRLRFGPVRVGSRGVERVTVTHTGGSAPLVLGLRLDGRYRLLGRAAGLSTLVLAPGGSIRLRVAFTPGRRGRATGRLTLTRADGLQPGVGAGLAGRGVRSADG